MKKIFYLVCIVLLLTLSSFADTDKLSGSGTADDPYVISCYEDFYEVALAIKNGDTDLAMGSFVMSDSINFHGKTFIPIGTKDNPFSGVFDGAGYCLNDISLSSKDAGCGVFAYAENASIKNLGVVNAVFTLLPDSSEVYCGLVCGSFVISEKKTDSAIEGCSASGKITVLAPNVSYGYVGGIVGSLSAIVASTSILAKNCSADCELFIRADSAYCGGFAGSVNAQKATITTELAYLYTKGTLSALSVNGNAYCGGLAGYINAEESGWGEWMGLEEQASLLSDNSYVISRSISLCSVEASSSNGTAFSSYSVAQTHSGPDSYRIYCTGTDNSIGGICGTTVSESSVSNSSFVKSTLGFDLTNLWTLEDGLRLKRNTLLCAALSEDFSEIHVRANGYHDSVIFVASYDGDGRLIEMKKSDTVLATDGYFKTELSQTPCLIKVFSLKKDSLHPVCLPLSRIIPDSTN